MAPPCVDTYYRPPMTDIPAHAKRLSLNEVLQMQWKHIGEEKDRSKVWPFTMGVSLLSATSAITGIVFVSIYRRRFHLGGLSLPLTYLPAAVVPTGFSALGNIGGIANEILTGQFNNCVVCAQTRAVLLQIAGGLFYPFIVAPVCCVTAAKKHGTYNVPALYPLSELRKNGMKLLRPIWPAFTVCAIAHVLLSAYVARKQQEKFVAMMKDSPLIHTS